MIVWRQDKGSWRSGRRPWTFRGDFKSGCPIIGQLEKARGAKGDLLIRFETLSRTPALTPGSFLSLNRPFFEPKFRPMRYLNHSWQ
jgi:hypothetical protein